MSESVEATFERFKNSAGDPFDLHDELAMMRTTVQDVLTLYETQHRVGTLDQQVLAGQVLRRTLADVARFVEKFQKIRLAGALTQLSQAQLLSGVQELVTQYFGDDPRAMRLLQELPALGQSTLGTTITPDQAAIAMDATIPFCEEEIA